MKYPLDISLNELRKFAADMEKDYAFIRYDEDADCMWLAPEDNDEDTTPVIYLDPRRYEAIIPVMDDLTCCFGYKQTDF